MLQCLCVMVRNETVCFVRVFVSMGLLCRCCRVSMRWCVGQIVVGGVSLSVVVARCVVVLCFYGCLLSR